MSKLVSNYDGGTTDQYGTFLAFNRFLQGEVIEGLAVTAQASPNMTVLVGTGSGRIPTGTSPNNYGFFIGVDTAGGESVAIATAAASPRIDYIVAYIDLAVSGSTSPTNVNNKNNVLKFADVQGTPSGSPVVPTVSQIQTAIGASNPYSIYASVDVGANVTQITNANIHDLRTMATATIKSGGVIPNNLVSGAGTSWAWQAWTPTFTNFTLGNGTINVAKYAQIGKTVFLKLRVTLGSTSSVTGVVTASLPVTAASDEVTPSSQPFSLIGMGTILDNGTTQYSSYFNVASTTTVTLLSENAASTSSQPQNTSATVPMTWATGDAFYIHAQYEAA